MKALYGLANTSPLQLAEYLSKYPSLHGKCQVVTTPNLDVTKTIFIFYSLSAFLTQARLLIKRPVYAVVLDSCHRLQDVKELILLDSHATNRFVHTPVFFTRQDLKEALSKDLKVSRLHYKLADYHKAMLRNTTASVVGEAMTILYSVQNKDKRAWLKKLIFDYLTSKQSANTAINLLEDGQKKKFGKHEELLALLSSDTAHNCKLVFMQRQSGSATWRKLAKELKVSEFDINYLATYKDRSGSISNSPSRQKRVKEVHGASL